MTLVVTGSNPVVYQIKKNLTKSYEIFENNISSSFNYKLFKYFNKSIKYFNFIFFENVNYNYIINLKNKNKVYMLYNFINVYMILFPIYEKLNKIKILKRKSFSLKFVFRKRQVFLIISNDFFETCILSTSVKLFLKKYGLFSKNLDIFLKLFYRKIILVFKKKKINLILYFSKINKKITQITEFFFEKFYKNLLIVLIDTKLSFNNKKKKRLSSIKKNLKKRLLKKH